MKRVYTSRTPSESYQRCKRMRWLGFHEGEEGMGLQPIKRPLPLAVGGAEHTGLATLLILSKDIDPSAFPGAPWRFIEDQGVADALADFEKEAREGLEVELNEQLAGVANTPAAMLHNFSGSLSMEDLKDDFFKPAATEWKIDPLSTYLYKEQSALVEAMVRAYARRRLIPLLEHFEVLEVEKEGEWRLSEWQQQEQVDWDSYESESFELWFQSRPDALLRERSTGDLHIMSYKTTSTWDKRKDKDAQRDMQGLSEGVEVERRLGERISAIRYEYLLKGYRSEDKQMPTKWVQNTSLVRPYISQGMTSGDVSFAHSYEWTDQSTMKQKRLDYRTWKRGLITEHIPVSEWIDMLDRGEVQDTATDDQGWVIDPLKDAFVPAVTVYRQDDDLRDWIEQEEAQEVQVAKDVEQVQGARDAEEKRSLLNQLFPQTRRACSYPGECAFVHVCYGSAEAKTDPLGTGLYQIRVPNHPVVS